MKRKIYSLMLLIALLGFAVKSNADNCWVRPCMAGVDPGYRCHPIPTYCMKKDGGLEYLGYALYCIEFGPGVSIDAPKCDNLFFE